MTTDGRVSSVHLFFGVMSIRRRLRPSPATLKKFFVGPGSPKEVEVATGKQNHLMLYRLFSIILIISFIDLPFYGIHFGFEFV